MGFEKQAHYHPKSIWHYSDDELFNAYGQAWKIAREMIDAHNVDVANGFLEDWDGISQFWVGQEPTENQVMMLVQNGYKPIYDKRDTSVLIDYIIFNANLKREVLWRKKKSEREAQKVAARAEKQRVKDEAREKREYELKVKNSANIERVRKSFEKLWNELLADDKFTEVEIYKLKQWCGRHKHLNDDFHDMIALCDKVVEDHVVDAEENGLLYDEAIRMIERMSPVE